MILLAILLPLALGSLLVTSSTPTDILDDLPTDIEDAVDTVQQIEADANSQTGDGGPDILTGTEDPDWLNGRGGNDIIDGRGHDDTLLGQSGEDTIYGRGGEDIIAAGFGNDWVEGGNERDIIDGGRGDDTLFGGQNNDLIGGDSGDDLIFGGNYSDILLGNRGGDTIDGESGNDIIIGGFGADQVIGSEGNDILYGGEVDAYGVNTGETDNTTQIIAGLRAVYADDPTLFDSATPAQIFARPEFDGLGITTTAPGIGDTDADTLTGGLGNDILILEDGDTGNGGLGFDVFAVPVEAPATAITIEDYDDRQDQIVVHYQGFGSGGPIPLPGPGLAPTVTVSHAAGVSSVMVGGTILANVTDPTAQLMADDILVVDRDDIVSALASGVVI